MLEALAVNEVKAGLQIEDTLQGVPVQVFATLFLGLLFGFDPNNHYRDVLVLFAFIVSFGATDEEWVSCEECGLDHCGAQVLCDDFRGAVDASRDWMRRLRSIADVKRTTVHSSISQDPYLHLHQLSLYPLTVILNPTPLAAALPAHHRRTQHNLRFRGSV
ncbi:hypothetical protein BJV78DRAFT_1283166 [Lactifluus subvellereus]|nr:hypothetical protein BJV78DRAFT_1283166 [Lactifluus subvellereus]